MAEILFTNNASTKLFSTIDKNATELTVSPGTGALFPVISPSKDEHFRVTIVSSTGDFEIVKVTARVDDRFTIERAQEGTIARSFEQNSIVELRLTAGSIEWIAHNLAELDSIVTINTAVMKGATSSKDGASGVVPKPVKGSQNKVLRADATWVEIDSLPAFEDIDNKVDSVINTKIMPVGSIYVQFANQSDPATLFGGEWSNISSDFAGLFFRAEGGDAASFGSTQTGGLPNILGNTSKTVKATQNSSASWNGALGVDKASSGGAVEGGSSNTVTTIRFDASKSNSLYGSCDEIRPVNSTIRIWKRIK